MKRFTLLLAIIMCVILTGCQSVIVREKNDVYATVTEVQYKDSSVWYNPALKMPQVLPEKYLVTISYEGISETFDNKTLYESVKEGDTIQMILCSDYDENGNLIKQTLEIPE